MTVTGTPGCSAAAVRDVHELLQITRSARVSAAQRSTSERPGAIVLPAARRGSPARRATGAKVAYDQGA